MRTTAYLCCCLAFVLSTAASKTVGILNRTTNAPIVTSYQQCCDLGPDTRIWPELRETRKTSTFPIITTDTAILTRRNITENSSAILHISTSDTEILPLDLPQNTSTDTTATTSFSPDFVLDLQY
ncbi:hypothetical protein STSP2_02865 [Anaerohalosphaera lusitana]|uniref:Uncharacterized protein n=1 Tax=Anaerohalosphaera lusitana TaxID=1936003 RepID=A0A1U9NP27_9BACT|nr:hypothetical protein [Anaerohalosphaera lusitana]AQT69671.1 hypothetical protein STSP2_02865 [Anaerohalosphaera lusitana]